MGSPGDRRYATPPLEIFGKVLVVLTAVLGLLGLLLVVVGGDGRSPEDAEPTSVEPARSPVCLRVASQGSDERSPFESTLMSRFATTGSDLFVGWPRLVDGFWRWDGVGADARYVLDASDVTEAGTVVDEQLVSWTELDYDLAPSDAGAWRAAATLMSGGDADRAARLAALGADLSLTVPSTYVGDGLPDDALPHPLAPDSIPPGGTLVVDAGAYASAGQEAAADALSAAVPELGDDDVAVGVTPLGRDRVTVTIGTEAAVRRASSLGLQVGSASGALTDSDVGDYALLQLTLDLGVAADRATYLDLLEGSVPDADADDGHVHRVDVTGGARAADRARALAPEVAVADSFFADDVTRSVEERTDGTVTFTRSRPAEGQARRFAEVYDADGEPSSVSALVRMVDVSEADASRYNRTFAGSEAEVSGPVTIDLVLDTADLEQVRADATVLAAQRFNDDAAGKAQARQALGVTGLVTPDDVAGWLEDTVPARAERVVEAITRGDDFVEAALADVLVAMADGVDDWTTYLAFTTPLEGEKVDAPVALAEWGAAVDRAQSASYAGFGRATCTSVD